MTQGEKLGTYRRGVRARPAPTLSAMLMASVTRLKPDARRYWPSIPRNAGAPSDRMQQSSGPERDRAVEGPSLSTTGGRCEGRAGGVSL